MKKTITSVTLRGGMAAALGLSFLLYPPLRLSSTAAARAAVDVKTESQYRAEAARYDGAIRAIAGIATMKLETGDDLKKAFAILEREFPNLKLRFSKFVVLGLNDPTFSSAVKKKAADKRAAEAFAKELEADRKAILKLEGAEALKTRIRRSAESDAATLRRAGERLKEVGERIKKGAQKSAAPSLGATDEFKVIRAGFSVGEGATVDPAPRAMSPTDPVTVGIIISALIIGTSLVSWVFGFITHDLSAEENKEEECLEKARDSYSRCESNAKTLPSGFPLFIREAALALCYGQLLLETSACHLLT